jgi:hypothetical protein
MHVTWTDRLDPGDAARYDAFVLGSPGGHPFQTRTWATVAGSDPRVALSYVLIETQGRLVGCALVSRPRIPIIPLPWAWIDRGPVVHDAGDLPACLDALERAARGERLLRLRVMPYWAGDDAERAERALAACGYKDVQRADGPHARTLRLALPAGGDDPLRGKASAQIRWRVRQAERAGAEARHGMAGDWGRVRALHASLMERQGKRGRPEGWWRQLEAFVADDTRGAMFVCIHETRLVAACVVIRHGPVATYAWGASVDDRLAFTKAVLPLVAAVRWAAKAGCNVFDLGGIPLPGDHDPKRNSIALLKRDFGGTPLPLAREHARWLVC